MVEPRHTHTATLLRDGRVLIVGGTNDEGLVAAAEIFDPETSAWTRTGALNEPRSGHTATLLGDGSVLVVGGFGATGDAPIATAERFDANTGSWIPTAPMLEARAVHEAVLLAHGRVLVTGGGSGGLGHTALASSEIYDPATGAWTATAALFEARVRHTATVLRDGRVLVAGGFPGSGGVSPVDDTIATAELFDPAAGAWTPTGPMHQGRGRHTATLLGDGTVLVTRLGRLGSAERYDPTSGTWATTGDLASVRFVPTATLLEDGTVLVAGGYGEDPDGDVAARSGERYHPDSGTWTAAGTMEAARTGHTATRLADGTVLVAGGAAADAPSAEIYEPGR
jgi:hypothetical protein